MKTRVPSDTSSPSITTAPPSPGTPVTSIKILAEDTGELMEITVRGNKQIRMKNLDANP